MKYMVYYSNLFIITYTLSLCVSCSEKPRTTDSLRAGKQYTAQEIVQMIKELPEYIGDSVRITRNGKVISDNDKIQGTIRAILAHNSEGIAIEAENTKIPFQVLLYRNAAIHYKVQFPDDLISLKNISIDTLLMQKQGMTVVKKTSK